MPQPAGFVPDGFEPDPPKAAPGYWEDKGIGGKVWHPPAGVGKERTRVDNSLLGLPPELAVASGVGVMRAAAAPGLNAAARGMAAIKALAAEAEPVIKYEVAKSAMEYAGVPAAVATPIAMMLSGYRKGGKAATTAGGEAKTAAADAERAAARPAAPAPPAAEAAPSVARPQPPVATPPTAAKPSMSAMESKEYLRLRTMGKTDAQARDLIRAQREMAKRLGLPTADEASRAVRDRNATGRWREEE